jgi:predicted metallopeptidase
MGIKYAQAEDIKKEAEDIIKTMGWDHIDLNHLGFLRSHGSVAPRTIARCHALGKAMQIAMGRPKGFYLVEVISEKFDRLSKDEQTKTIIHELMHIPKTFGGGFIHHDVVHERNVRVVFEQYLSIKKKNVFYMLNKQTENDGKVETITFIEEKNSSPASLKPNPALKDAMSKMEKKFRWF